MRKLIVCVLIMFVMTGMVFAGAQAESPQKTINVWFGMTGPDGAYIEDLIKAFEKENPDIKVIGNAYEWATLWVKLEAAYAAGNPPESVIMHVQDIPQFVEKGMLASIPANGYDPSLYLENTLEGGRYKGVQYGLPIDLHTATMYYNVDMFLDAGLDPDNPPRTYDELVEAAKRLTIPEKGQWGFGLDTKNDGTHWAFISSYFQNGGKLLSDDFKRALIDNEAMRKTLNQYKDLAWKYNVSPRYLEDSVREFRSKNIAIIFNGTWQNALKGGVPEVEGLNYRSAKQPLFGDIEAYWKSGHVVTTINNLKPGQKALGEKFTRFASENSVYWNQSAMIPVTKAAMDDPRLARLKVLNKGSIEQMEFGQFVPLVPRGASELFDSSLDRPISKMIQTYYTDPTISVDSVVVAAQEALQRILSRYY